MVEIFKTDVHQKRKAAQLIKTISDRYPVYKISFDLDDIDKILRVESICEPIEAACIMEILKNNAHFCEPLK